MARLLMATRKLVIEQKVVDDHYVRGYVWTVVEDETGKVVARGEGATRDDCRAKARRHLK